MDRWHLMHDYRKMVQAGKMPAPMCDICENPLFTTIGKNDDPELVCWNCNHKVTLLPAWFTRIEKELEIAKRNFSV